MSRETKANSNSNSICNSFCNESKPKGFSNKIKISNDDISLLISRKKEIKTKISKYIENISQKINSFKKELDQVSKQASKKLEKISKQVEGIKDFQEMLLDKNKMKSIEKKAKLITKKLNETVSEDINLISNDLNEKIQKINSYIKNYLSSKKETFNRSNLSSNTFDYEKRKQNIILNYTNVLKYEKEQLIIELHRISTKDEEIKESIKLLQKKKKKIDELNVNLKIDLLEGNQKVLHKKQEISYLEKKSRMLNKTKKVIEDDLSLISDDLITNKLKKLSLNELVLLPFGEIESLSKLIKSLDSILIEKSDFFNISLDDKDSEKYLSIIYNLKQVVVYQKKKIEELEFELDKTYDTQENEKLFTSQTLYISYLEKSKEDLIQQIKTSGLYLQECVDKIIKDKDKVEKELFSKQNQFNELLENYTTLYNHYYNQNSTEIKNSE